MKEPGLSIEAPRIGSSREVLWRGLAFLGTSICAGRPQRAGVVWYEQGVTGSL